MPTWIKCTQYGTKKPVFVNIEQAAAIIPIGSGSRIDFPGDTEERVDVSESPEEVMTMEAFKIQ